jgi:signal peptidase I
MVVPGWAQWYTGRTVRAIGMFGGYLGLLLSGLLFIGTGLGLLLLGLAFSLHAASLLDVLGAGVLNFRQRLIYSGVAMLALMAAVYYPASQLLALVAIPQRFNLAAPPFEAGDVVLVNSSAYRSSDPQPGDVVHYRLPSRDARMAGPRGYPTIYRVQGDRIDRILARAGDKVTCDQGRLLVNGQLSPWLPLSPQPFPDGLEITVPENCYLIFPSTAALPPEVWQIASVVPRAEIWGRVYWRNQPLWRFGAIR